MSRPIDADRLKEVFKRNFCTVDVFEQIIDAQPTIDLVTRGEWILKHIGHGHYFECSVCYTNPCIYVTEDTKFCPNCGAKMGSEEE